MKLKVISGMTARIIKGSIDCGFTHLVIGIYPIRPIGDDLFEITKPNGSLCYLSGKKIEEKIDKKVIIILED